MPTAKPLPVAVGGCGMEGCSEWGPVKDLKRRDGDREMFLKDKKNLSLIITSHHNQLSMLVAHAQLGSPIKIEQTLCVSVGVDPHGGCQ
ncbi:hypothetical protein T4B_11136 [Trichinella pseudospiralis]|uniref:Uncharacterized protein n=1 Tax=Trichinella pseudospiralis TaxID=6337 RepID=A0A0V1IJK0_TRIPS|nr:hypothetical protein T4B_11136 [Trichinella pseudospiralis]